jgi:Mg/Co/Ni transporter MgtE
MLSGKEQQAFFDALDDEKAAETLAYAEPRAKRQLIATLRKEKVANILSELSIPQLADRVLAPATARLSDVMIPSVVAAEEETPRDELEEMFAKYHFRMIPVLDVQDRLLGVIHYNDIMQGLVTRAKP